MGPPPPAHNSPRWGRSNPPFEEGKFLLLMQENSNRCSLSSPASLIPPLPGRGRGDVGSLPSTCQTRALSPHPLHLLRGPRLPPVKAAGPPGRPVPLPGMPGTSVQLEASVLSTQVAGSGLERLAAGGTGHEPRGSPPSTWLPAGLHQSLLDRSAPPAPGQANARGPRHP